MGARSLSACGGKIDSATDGGNVPYDGAVDNANSSGSSPGDNAAFSDAGESAFGDDAGSSDGGESAFGNGDASRVQGNGACVPPELSAPICNSITATGALVPLASASGNPPLPTGGKIVDGTYVLVSSALYGGNGSDAPSQTTWVICGSHWSIGENTSAVTEQNGQVSSTPLTRHMSFSASISGASVVLTQVCSSDQVNYSHTRQFSVSGNRLTFFQSSDGTTLATTYERQ